MDLKNYKTPPRVYDEMLTEKNRARPGLSALVNYLRKTKSVDIAERSRKAEMAIRTMGITFTVYGDEKGTERVFPFDPFPRVVPAGEWEHIEAGLVQRITALNLFLYDVYHEQRIIKDGIIPTEVIHGAAHYRHQ